MSACSTLCSPPEGAPTRDQALPDYSGELIILAGREMGGRERGLMMACGATVAASTVATMAVHARGIVGVALDVDQADRAGLRAMQGVAPMADTPQFLASIEAAACSGTGISADDRAMTIQALCAATVCPEDLVSPGHIFPILIPKPKSSNPGLMALAFQIIQQCGDQGGAVVCDILNDQGDLATISECEQLAKKLSLRLVTPARRR